MNKSVLIFLGAATLLTSCKSKSDEGVVSQRYIHKYGYDVSKEEWDVQRYPGQVLTTFRNGKTITETYEDTFLHGEKTVSFEHSQTVQTKEIYQKGILTKRTTFNIRGVPEQETVFKTPSHLLITNWYTTGSPKAKEEYRDGKLINGQYYSLGNETDSCITNGNGEKTVRNTAGDLLSKEVYTNYKIAYIETYHPNNTPSTITSYNDDKIHGEIKKYALSGEPLSIENYRNGKKHGICTYYQNGYKYQETTYTEGRKDGIEKFYIDGETLSEETEYKAGNKHGPSIVFCDGTARTFWYFNNQKVSKSTFDQYEEREVMISSIQ